MILRGLNLRWLAPVCLVFGVVLVSGLSGAGAQDSEDGHDHDHDHSDLVHHEHFTPPGGEDAWPPRPVGAPELQPADPMTSAERGSANTNRNAVGTNQRFPNAAGEATIAPPSAVIEDPEVIAALGTDFSPVSVSEAQQGKYDSIGRTWTWFSRSNNQTVVVEEDVDGSPIVSAIDASDMQPIISNQERVLAHDIGMDWLLNNGFPEAEGLQGLSIRALDDGEFYDVRMAYVTFATDNFADPTHSVLVDLTNLTAVSGRSL